MIIDDNYLIKEIYDLREIDKLEFFEIAHKLNLSNSETRKFYNRGKARIRKYGYIKDKPQKKENYYNYKKKYYSKICEICKKEFETNLSKKKTCSDECKYIRHKKLTKERFKNWYEKNKKHQNKNIQNDYKKHKNRWEERKYVNRNKEKIFIILGKKCRLCDSEIDVEIHHIRYNNLPKDNLLEYTKYLLPLCKECHRRF